MLEPHSLCKPIWNPTIAQYIENLMAFAATVQVTVRLQEPTATIVSTSVSTRHPMTTVLSESFKQHISVVMIRDLLLDKI